jgi:lipoprotein-anchoring transpeptidase ErfK/SrfK
MTKRASAVAILAMLAAGQASAAPPAETVSLTLPADAFKLTRSVHTQLAATASNIAVESVSIELDLRPLPALRKPALPPSATLTARLQQTLTPELAKNFDLFLYVSKAARGPIAQHMYVFRRRMNGAFDLLHDWPVSTGREKVENNALGITRFTATPPGYYELDPLRIFAEYHSVSWDEPMPHAMFFDAWHKGARVGLAIHAADNDGIDALGARASAGCVRLSPEHAQALFQLVNAEYRGAVPQLAYDRATQSTRRDGALMRDAHGQLQFRKGYRVLVIIEDFGGKEIAT